MASKLRKKASFFCKVIWILDIVYCSLFLTRPLHPLASDICFFCGPDILSRPCTNKDEENECPPQKFQDSPHNPWVVRRSLECHRVENTNTFGFCIHGVSSHWHCLATESFLCLLLKFLFWRLPECQLHVHKVISQVHFSGLNMQVRQTWVCHVIVLGELTRTSWDVICRFRAT